MLSRLHILFECPFLMGTSWDHHLCQIEEIFLFHSLDILFILLDTSANVMFRESWFCTCLQILMQFPASWDHDFLQFLLNNEHTPHPHIHSAFFPIHHFPAQLFLCVPSADAPLSDIDWSNLGILPSRVSLFWPGSKWEARGLGQPVSSGGIKRSPQRRAGLL